MLLLDMQFTTYLRRFASFRRDLTPKPPYLTSFANITSAYAYRQAFASSLFVGDALSNSQSFKEVLNANSSISEFEDFSRRVWHCNLSTSYSCWPLAASQYESNLPPNQVLLDAFSRPKGTCLAVQSSLNIVVPIGKSSS
eukprot:s2442_g22.t1